MKLITKTFVFLCALVLATTTNLKLYRNLDAKNTYFTDFEEDRSKLLINKFFSIPKSQNTTLNFLNLFQDIGDKTFICVILLYFNSSAAYLFISTLVMKIIYLSTKHYIFESFISEFYLFKVIFPVKIFQFLGVVFYQICGYAILFKMIFTKTDSTAYKKTETEDIQQNFNFQEKLKLIFIILFSFFSSFNIESANEREMLPLTLSKFFTNLASVLIGLALALGIGHAIFTKFSKEFTLIITSITFLLMSIDGAVKVFVY